MSTPAQYLGTGKRKTSVARVILRPGDGATWINGKTIEEYFPRMVHRMLATAPLKVADSRGSTTCACACTAAARPVRPVRCGTGSPALCSRSTPSFARRCVGLAS